MIVVITLPTFIPNEADAIVRLFDERGIDRLHIRKPGMPEADVASLIAQIPERYYPLLSVHDHHALALQFGLGGIHLNGRCPEPPVGWQGLLSVSCHSLDELAQRKQETFAVVDGLAGQGRPRFDYLSLSPIFDSISKQGYRSAFGRGQLREAFASGIIDDRVLALGGVSFDRVEEVRAMGFGGAMILGDAWR